MKDFKELEFTTTNGVKTMSSIQLAELCVGTEKSAHSNFVIKMKRVLGERGVLKFQDTYLSVQNKELVCYNLPEREACLMAMSYSYELQAYVYDSWKAEEAAHTRTMEMMYDVITSKAFLGQEHGLKLAGIQHPRKFMQFFKESLVGLDWLIEKGYFSHRQVGANSTDRCWCWTQSGLEWLLENNTKLNNRVKVLMAA